MLKNDIKEQGPVNFCAGTLSKGIFYVKNLIVRNGNYRKKICVTTSDSKPIKLMLPY